MNEIAVIGLAVMGQNLARNMARNGFKVGVYNRSSSRTDELMNVATESGLDPTYDIATLVNNLERPRRLLLMVKAGAAVDAVIDELRPHLEPGDIIIDGGNSHFLDTNRRTEDLAEAGLLFIGTGISGGEEGALHGPSIMPGGSQKAYQPIEKILQAIAAKAVDGTPCVAYLGPHSAGHYVKMVHNGIEYGDMQLIAEAYDMLARAGGLNSDELADVFSEWNNAELQSFLIEITADIFRQRDQGKALVDLILDKAKQKGTGKWTSQDSFDLGIPIPTINAAVEARMLSGLKDERVKATTLLAGPTSSFTGTKAELTETVRGALYAAKVCAYAQGMALLQAASDEYGYDLDLGTVAAIWRAGCIIRARFLDDVTRAFQNQPDLPNLMLDTFFAKAIQERQDQLRAFVQLSAKLGIPTPAHSSALAYYDSYRSERLPANLIQAQRDYFGAHTYERTDQDGSFHTEWASE